MYIARYKKLTDGTTYHFRVAIFLWVNLLLGSSCLHRASLIVPTEAHYIQIIDY